MSVGWGQSIEIPQVCITEDSSTNVPIFIYDVSNLESIQIKIEYDESIILAEDIIENPQIGEQKKGDLSYLHVHKFDLSGRQTLLGYHFKEQELQLFMMQLGSHENFYQDVKNRNKANIKIIK